MFDTDDIGSIPRRPEREHRTALSPTGESCKTCKYFIPHEMAKRDEYGECYVAPPAGNQAAFAIINVFNKQHLIKNPGDRPLIDLRSINTRPRTLAHEFCSFHEDEKE